MGVIKTIFGLILIVVFVGFGYWTYATYTTRTGDDAIWAGINGMMPEVLQQWSCGEIRTRTGGAQVPQSCARFWDEPGPEKAAAPGAETDRDTDAPSEDADPETAPADSTAVE